MGDLSRRRGRPRRGSRGRGSGLQADAGETTPTGGQKRLVAGNAQAGAGRGSAAARIRVWDQPGSAELGHELGHGAAVTQFSGPCKSVHGIKRAVQIRASDQASNAVLERAGVGREEAAHDRPGDDPLSGFADASGGVDRRRLTGSQTGSQTRTSRLVSRVRRRVRRSEVAPPIAARPGRAGGRRRFRSPSSDSAAAPPNHALWRAGASCGAQARVVARREAPRASRSSLPPHEEESRVAPRPGLRVGPGGLEPGGALRGARGSPTRAEAEPRPLGACRGGGGGENAGVLPDRRRRRQDGLGRRRLHLRVGFGGVGVGGVGVGGVGVGGVRVGGVGVGGVGVGGVGVGQSPTVRRTRSLRRGVRVRRSRSAPGPELQV